MRRRAIPTVAEIREANPDLTLEEARAVVERAEGQLEDAYESYLERLREAEDDLARRGM